MARLPTVEDMGRRPTPRPVRPIASISPSAAAAPGRALAGFGATMSAVGDDIYERETTATAKERDAMVADEIRGLLYDPETGFLNKQGSGAVNQRNATLEQLERIKSKAMEGLNSGAQRKLSDALTRRMDSAMQSIDVHTSGARREWINGASQARITSAHQDALVDPSKTTEALRVMDAEILDMAAREGWSAEETALEREKARSKVYSDQVTRIAATDPIAAMSYMRDNQDSMSGVDIANLEAKLQPEVKAAIGRQKGQEAALSGVSTGYLAAIRNAESGGNDSARNPLSSATGRYQFIESTWREIIRRHPDLGLTLDGRTDPRQQELAIRAFTSDNAKILQNSGLDATGGNLYAAHFLGAGGALVVLGASDAVAVENLVPPSVISANPFLKGMSAGEFKAWANRKGGGSEVAFSDGAPDMTALLEIEDPIERKAAIGEYELRVSVAQGQEKARRAAAQDAAFQAIEAGTGVDKLPLDFRQSLGIEGMSALRTYENKLASGETVKTDPQTYLELRRMQANDPTGFGDVNLIEYVDRLSQTDFKSFADSQAEGVDPDTGVAASTLMSQADRHLKAAGIDTSPKPGSDDAASVAAIQTRLLRWQDEFMRDNRRKPTQTEIDERVANELIPVIIDPKGLGNKMDGAFFELSNLDLDAGELAETSINILDTDVPPAVINEQIIALRESGEDVTAENLVARIITMFEQAGIR